MEVLNLAPSELFSADYLKDVDLLPTELINKISLLKNSTEKLEKVYKLVKAVTDEL